MVNLNIFNFNVQTSNSRALVPVSRGNRVVPRINPSTRQGSRLNTHNNNGLTRNPRPGPITRRNPSPSVVSSVISGYVVFIYLYVNFDG